MSTPPPTEPPRFPWSWPGVVALVLAVCVGGGWLLGVLFAVIEAAEPPLDEHLAQLLGGLGQVLAGALATYLGYSVGASRDRPPGGQSPP